MTFKKLTDIPYIQNGHPRQNLDLYIPDTASASTPVPLIIYIHGGAFKVGSKESDLIPTRLLSQNYAIASLNYRLSGDAIFPAAVQDCKAAVRFLRASSQTYNLDPSRFVSMGESAGAYMAAMVGLPGTIENSLFDGHGDHPGVSADVLGTIDFYGPTDFLQMDAHAPEGSEFSHNAADSPESLFLGKQITKVPELVKTANPIEYVNDQTGPVLIAHGTKDRIVPFHQSELLHKTLESRERDVTFHRVDGVDHVFWGITQEQQTELDGAVDRWLLRVFGK